MTTATVQTEALEREQAEIVRRANDLAVTCGDDYWMAGEELRAIKTYRKAVDDTFGPLAKAAHEQHKAILATKAKFDTPAAQAEATIKRKMCDYQLAERRRAEAEAERQREAMRQQEEEKRLREAEELERQGHAEQAEAVIAAPVATPVVVARPDVPKVKGVTMRDNWKARVVNEDLIPRAYMVPDMKRIGEHARSMKAKAHIPGVEFYNEPVSSAVGY